METESFAHAGLRAGSAESPQGLQATVQRAMQQEQPEAAAQGIQQDPQQRVQQLESIVQGMQGHIETLMHRTSPQLRLALQHNARCTRLEHSLLPVPHPDTGTMPPNFPATYQGEPALAELCRACCP